MNEIKTAISKSAAESASKLTAEANSEGNLESISESSRLKARSGPVLTEGREHTITFQVRLRSMHRLWNSELSEEVNTALYGQCARFHGHDYHVQITFSNVGLAASGFLVDRSLIATILHEQLVEPFDGQDLNQHFKNTSCEALVIEFFNRLECALAAKLLNAQPALGTRLRKVAVQETPKNYFSYQR